MIIDNYQSVVSDIKHAAALSNRQATDISLVAVSKTFSADCIQPLLAHGHRIFGENRIQEVEEKWPYLRSLYSDIQLHLIGPLQSNKVRKAVQLVDVIETIDKPDLLDRLCRITQEEEKFPDIFIQVNIGEETQKAGCLPVNFSELVAMARSDYKGQLRGIMVIPPIDQEPAPYFAWARQLADDEGLASCSMGMSGDYKIAIAQGSNYVRVGSAIFGQRETQSHKVNDPIQHQ